MDLANYLEAELMVLPIILYILGMMLKKTPYLSDWGIPYILLVVSMVISGIYLFSISTPENFNQVLQLVFATIVQGFVAAGMAGYSNQLVKQFEKMKNGE